MAAPEQLPGCQRQFHQRWSWLNDPHVRTLAWLLDAPDMLDASAPMWQGRIAGLGPDAALEARDWLAALERDPATLHARLAVHRYTRLGRYAEQLLSFYFTHLGILEGQGIQVRRGSQTIGEFDFLLRQQNGLVHRELATKVYLLRSSGEGVRRADYFVGPNLADTLGAKMSKIIERQLSLSSHPSAASALPGPVVEAGALVKGWLFYPEGEEVTGAALPGLSPAHCRGSWRTLHSQRQRAAGERYLVLQRLQWLTPQSAMYADTVDEAGAIDRVEQAFAAQPMPVMLATMQEEQGQWRETERFFVVPDDWVARVGSSRHAASFPVFDSRD